MVLVILFDVNGSLVYSAIHEIPESNAQTALLDVCLSGAVTIDVIYVNLDC